MIHTEEVARTKWCPMVRIPYGWEGGSQQNSAIAATNRSKGETNSCIASDCMMWRRAQLTEVMGYCGLAGRPDK